LRNTFSMTIGMSALRRALYNYDANGFFGHILF